MIIRMNRLRARLVTLAVTVAPFVMVTSARAEGLLY